MNETEYNVAVHPLHEALSNAIAQHRKDLPDTAVAEVLIGLAQYELTSNSLRSNRFASGMENALRAFGAILRLHLSPQLGQQYIGEKFTTGFTYLRDAFREHRPPIKLARGM